jgi:L,D-transpeptidase catalytic domain
VRALRTLGLVLIVTATGLLSGGAAGATDTTEAIISLASGTTPGDRGAAGARVIELPVAPPPPVLPAPPATAPIATAPTAQLVAGPVPVAAAPVLSTPKAKPPAPVSVKGTPCRANASACIDLSANRAWLINDGKVQYGPVAITHGRKGFRTPPGSFRVSYKAADHVSSVYDAEMPYSVFFNGGIAFHEGSLKQLSHGCVHLSGKAAKTFFGALTRGELVQVVR